MSRDEDIRAAWTMVGFPRPLTFDAAIAKLEAELADQPRQIAKYPGATRSYLKRAELIRATLAWARAHRDELEPKAQQRVDEDDKRRTRLAMGMPRNFHDEPEKKAAPDAGPQLHLI